MQLTAKPLKADLEAWYAKEDPWGIRGTEKDHWRIDRISREFSGRSFRNAIDIGCGEGHLTAALPFVKTKTGVDLSSIAISRARQHYPGIRFETADILDLSRFEAESFDFISCLETIYYLEPGQQLAALDQIRRLGTRDCIYLFSVVTTGPNAQRNYHTREGARVLLSQRFDIQKEFAVTMSSKLPAWRRALVKVKLFSKQEQRRRHLMYGNIRDAYQIAFVCS